MASRIAGQLGIAHAEMDALYHGPDWTARGSFMADVAAFAAQHESVTEWQYSSARDLLAARADLVVWLACPWSRRCVRSLQGRCAVGCDARFYGTAIVNRRCGPCASIPTTSSAGRVRPVPARPSESSSSSANTPDCPVVRLHGPRKRQNGSLGRSRRRHAERTTLPRSARSIVPN